MNLELVSIVAVIAVAVLVVGLWLRTGEAALWLAAAIVGQAAALQIIDAGPRVHYQHFQPISELLSERFDHLTLLIVVQGMAAGARLLMLRGRARSHEPVLRGWQWCALALLFVGTSATLSREPGAYAQEIVVATIVQLVNLAAVLVFAITLPTALVKSARKQLTRVLGEKDLEPAIRKFRLDRFAVVCAVYAAMAAATLATFSYERHPHIADEVGYIVHARYFSQGMITMPGPPVPAAFDVDLLRYEPGYWYSPVPPGWPAMLAVGALFSSEWLVNPLLAGINVLLASLLVEGLYNTRIARMACVFLCVSPWHVFMATNFMTHTFSFTCALAAGLSVLWMTRTGSLLWAIPGGIALALSSMIRPLEGFAIALTMGLWSLTARGRWFRFAPSLVLTVVAVAVGSLQLVYNAALTGNARLFPIMKYMDELYYPGANNLGFGPNRGVDWPLDPFPGHGLRDVLVNSNLNITSINIELFGWAAGSILLIGVLVFSGGMTRKDWVLAAFIALIIGIHSFYWFSGGPDFAARYWYPVLLPCILLSIRGLDWLVNKIDLLHRGEGTRAALAVGAMMIAAVVTFFPWRAVDKYRNYRGMTPEIRHMADTVSFGRSIILVRGKRAPDYASAAIYNPLDLYADTPIYVWDRDQATRRQVLAAYSDRSVWFVDGPSITGRGYKIVGGPLKTQDAVEFPMSQLLRPTGDGKDNLGTEDR